MNRYVQLYLEKMERLVQGLEGRVTAQAFDEGASYNITKAFREFRQAFLPLLSAQARAAYDEGLEAGYWELHPPAQPVTEPPTCTCGSLVSHGWPHKIPCPLAIIPKPLPEVEQALKMIIQAVDYLQGGPLDEASERDAFAELRVGISDMRQRLAADRPKKGEER